jgi:hypothetical protein
LALDISGRLRHLHREDKDMKKRETKLAHACNPKYSGDEIRRIKVQSQPGEIVCETLF